MLDRFPGDLKGSIAGFTSEPVLEGEAGATVLRCTAPDGRVLFLKHGTGRVADDVVDEMVRLRWLAGRVPCASVVHFVQDGQAAWLLTTGVGGKTGDQWLELDPGFLPTVIDAYAACLRRLHALPVADCPFDASAAVRMAAARRNLDAGLVDIDDFDDDHAGWSGEQVWDELGKLAPPTCDRVVTHGDFSLGNVLLDAGGRLTGVIDVGRLGVADPYQDIAIFWQNLGHFGATAQEQFLTAYGITAVDDRRLAFHRCLDEMF